MSVLQTQSATVDKRGLNNPIFKESVANHIQKVVTTIIKGFLNDFWILKVVKELILFGE